MQKVNTNKIDANELEHKIIKYFEYMENLNKRMRVLKRKIKIEQEVLNEELSQQKKYIDILTSLNIGKGKYYEISMLPYEMMEYMNSKFFNDFTEEQKIEYKKNYGYAVIQAEKLQDEYKKLTEESRERIIRIKEYKNDISNYKKNLSIIQNEYKKNLLKAKKIDKEIKKYMVESKEKPKQYVNKPNKQNKNEEGDK